MTPWIINCRICSIKTEYKLYSYSIMLIFKKKTTCKSCDIWHLVNISTCACRCARMHTPTFKPNKADAKSACILTKLPWFIQIIEKYTLSHIIKSLVSRISSTTHAYFCKCTIQYCSSITLLKNCLINIFKIKAIYCNKWLFLK